MREYIFLDNARVIIVLAFTAIDAINYLQFKNIIAEYKGSKENYMNITNLSQPSIIFDSKDR